MEIFKDEVNSLKNSFSQSFGSMSKEIAKDMTGALTKVDEKVGVFNQQGPYGPSHWAQAGALDGQLAEHEASRCQALGRRLARFALMEMPA